ncbi:Piso0_004535 [Millerozyma farinosa CBS 7064]|uniref:Serine/threonine-protein kinase Tel1 n=1 Tax=Pichia sorbitophila (strain ATCC MYA-4447 / BCRC 22081 / CBS 7064 / NBRC 10061 / NRRL Y-12695) TaxID=559304 RepID=G8Y924_PICSO|nr:Piso0_004535 [Millerozyma farinosa CBS 7064]CCE84969.1 Piso0_004535 [Millerozyma farinosa CBS 7064]
MDANDISRICILVQSSKIKERNEGLDELERLASARWTMNQKQFDSIVNSVLMSIASEQTNYLKNNALATEQRINKASTALLLLVRKSLRFNQELMHRGMQSKIKYKVYLNLCMTIKNIFFLNDKVYDFYGVDFARILHTVVSEGFFMEHINVDDWRILFSFTIDSCFHFLKIDQDANGYHHKMTMESFTILHFLIMANLPLLSQRLHLSFSKVDHSILYNLLFSAFSLKKKDSFLTVILLKIVNKLVISFSTEDAFFARSLINLVFKVGVQFFTSQYESIQNQCLIFVNIPAVRKFAGSEPFPSLPPEQNFDENSSLESGTASLFSDSDTQRSISSSDDSLLVYNLGSLICNLIYNLYYLPTGLDFNNVGLILDRKIQLNIFNLGSKFFSSGSLEETPSLRSWLALSSLVKLCDLFYELRSKSNKGLDTSFTRHSDSSEASVKKRQKLDNVKTALAKSYDPAEFYEELINSMDERLRRIGLQLLTFHYEISLATISQYSEKKGAIEEHLCSPELIPFLSFNFVNGHANHSKFLKLVLMTFDNTRLNYWSLLACNVIVNTFIKLELLIDDNSFCSAFKISLDLLRQKDSSELACDIISLLLRNNTNALHADESIKGKIETIVDLADTYGPYFIGKAAFNFWFAIGKSIKTIGFSKAFSLNRKITDWLISRLGSTFSENFELVDELDISYFITWLSGKLSSARRRNIPILRAFSFERSHHETVTVVNNIEDFMFFQDRKSKHVEYDTSEGAAEDLFSELSIPQDLFYKLADFSKTFAKFNQGMAFKWCVTLLEYSQSIKESTLLAELTSLIQTNCLVTFEEIKNTSIECDITRVSEIFNQVNYTSLSNEVLQYIASSYVINSILEKARNNLIETHDRNRVDSELVANTFSSEFDSSPRETSYSPRELHPDLLYDLGLFSHSTCISIVKLMFNFGIIKAETKSRTIEEILSYCNNLTPYEVLEVLDYISSDVTSGKIKKSELSASTVKLILRTIGEHILSHHMLERSDNALTLVANFSKVAISINEFVVDQAYYDDCKDLMDFLWDCGSKHLLLGSESYFQYLSLLCYILSSDFQYKSQEEIRLEFVTLLSDAPNYLKFRSIPLTIEHMRRIPVPDQMNFYRKIYSTFELSHSKSSQFLTTTILLLLLGKCSFHIMISALFNLMEFSKLPNFSHCMKFSLKLIYGYENSSLLRKFFKNTSLSLLKFWFIYGHEVKEFPYEIYGYDSFNSFINNNFREIVALTLSNYEKFKHNIKLHEVSEIMSLSHNEIISESLSLIIPMAYGKMGVRNKVFDDLSSFLGSNLKGPIQDNLFLILSQIVKCIDVVQEEELLNWSIDKKNCPITTSRSAKLASSLVSISSRTGHELFTSILEQYSRKDSDWKAKVYFFIVIDLCRQFKSSMYDDQRRMNLRRMRFLIISNKELSSSSLCFTLLVDTYSSNMMNPIVSHEVVSIFNLFKLENIVKDKRTFLAKIAKLSGILLHNNSYLKAEHNGMIHVLNRFLAKSLDEHKEITILRASLLASSKEEFQLRTSDIECFFNQYDDYFFLNCELLQNMVFLIAHLFPRITVYDDAGSFENVVKVILNLNLTSYINKKDFMEWCATYVGRFYSLQPKLSGSSHLIYSKRIELSEMFSIIKEHEPLNYIIRSVVDNCQTDTGENILAYDVLSVIMWESKSDEKEYNFFNIGSFNNWLKHLLPFDYHTFRVLNENIADPIVKYTSLNDFVTSFPVISTQCTILDWSNELLLTILLELSIKKTLAYSLYEYALSARSFAKRLIPTLVCQYLKWAKKNQVKTVIEFIKLGIDGSITNNTVRTFLEIVLFLRMGSSEGVPNFGVVYDSIDLSKVYKISLEQNLPETALLFFEEYFYKNSFRSWLQNSSELSDIYEMIDNNDLIHGLPQETSIDHSLKMLYRFSDPLQKLHFSSAELDAKMTLGSDFQKVGTIKHMREHGMLGIPKMLSDGRPFSDSEEESYEIAWKLNSWNVPASPMPMKPHEFYYSLVKSIHDYPSKAYDFTVHHLTRAFSLKDQIYESSTTAKEFKESMNAWMSAVMNISSIQKLLKTSDKNILHFEHKFIQNATWLSKDDIYESENFHLLRKSIYQILAENSTLSKSYTSDYLWACAFTNLLSYNKICISAAEPQRMVTSLLLMNEIVDTKFERIDSDFEGYYSDIERSLKFQSALTLWNQKQGATSISILKELMHESNGDLKKCYLSASSPMVKSYIIEWTSESRQESSHNIMEKYVLPTAEEIGQDSPCRDHGKIYYILANFCENQYRSPNLIDQIQILDRQVELKKKEIDEMKVHYGKTPVARDEKKTVQKYYSKLKASLNSETVDLTFLQENRTRFLLKAGEFYLKSILINSDDEEILDKFFSLWLEHSNKAELHERIKDDMKHLPSHCLISWSTQLFSRLSYDHSEFQNIVSEQILKLCRDHPFHSLYGLMSLRKHESYARNSENRLLELKSSAADKIWKSLCLSSEDQLVQTLSGVDELCAHAIALAEHKCGKSRTVDIRKLTSGDFWLYKLPKIPPPTLSLKVDLTKKYDKVPLLTSIDPSVSVASSGLSLPKIVTFQLTDGTQHKALFKHGTDDLRQDSIMEQVFEKVNNIFSRDRECSQRSLRIRTYKAIPLGPEAGMIEFVPNSIALIDVIRPYHQIRDKMKPEKARELMKNSQGADMNERIKIFERICQDISPVLGNFFFDNFDTPEKWFASKVCYTRGIATTSIVGHILGLGDRHCNNILLDKDNGEPVHIDLGVAFDQGKKLPIPETVPFRLTRDIIDGFGITGTAGMFSISCNHTYRVLRDNQKHILAVLDVLRWDPLYSWIISPIRRKKIQTLDTKGDPEPVKLEEDGSEGSRALLKVAEKLSGGGLSIEATVRELTQEASSYQNLALIYYGWCPFF